MKKALNMIRKLTFFVGVLMLLAGCSREKPHNPDSGTIEDGFYTNAFFGFDLSIPEKWVVQNFKQSQNQEEVHFQPADSLEKQIVNLLTLFKYHPASTEEFNPSFIIMAERLPTRVSTMDEISYLTLTQQQLQKTGLYQPFDTYGTKVKLGNAEFYSMKVSSQSDKPVHQEFFTRIKDGYALVFITSYVNAEQKAELDTILKSITGF